MNGRVVSSIKWQKINYLCPFKNCQQYYFCLQSEAKWRFHGLEGHYNRGLIFTIPNYIYTFLIPSLLHRSLWKCFPFALYCNLLLLKQTHYICMYVLAKRTTSCINYKTLEHGVYSDPEILEAPKFRHKFLRWSIYDPD